MALQLLTEAGFVYTVNNGRITREADPVIEAEFPGSGLPIDNSPFRWIDSPRVGAKAGFLLAGRDDVVWTTRLVAIEPVTV